MNKDDAKTVAQRILDDRRGADYYQNVTILSEFLEGSLACDECGEPAREAEGTGAREALAVDLAAARQAVDRIPPAERARLFAALGDNARLDAAPSDGRQDDART